MQKKLKSGVTAAEHIKLKRRAFKSKTSLLFCLDTAMNIQFVETKGIVETG